MKNTEPSKNEEGEENEPPQSDDGENVIASDKRESTNEEASTYGDEFSEQRFVDHTFYRGGLQPTTTVGPRPIKAGIFRHRRPGRKKPRGFKICCEASRIFHHGRKRVLYLNYSHEAQKDDALQALEAGNYGEAHKLFK